MPTTGDRQSVPDKTTEGISPGFFRDIDNSQMYACHHYPGDTDVNDQAVLLCHATAHEYERCHRAMRQLAIQLARSGHHVMRFDYSGTGDSAGDYEHASFAQWRQDITDASRECLHQSKKSGLCVIGIRLGATLAAQAIATMENIESLILYAPVVQADELLEEWQQEQAKHDRSVNRREMTDSQHEILGFPLTQRFRDDLNNITEFPPPNASLRNVLILVDREEDREREAIKQMVNTLSSRGAKVVVNIADADAIWRQRTDKAMVPFKLLRRMVMWLKDR